MPLTVTIRESMSVCGMMTMACGHKVMGLIEILSISKLNPQLFVLQLLIYSTSSSANWEVLALAVRAWP